MDEKIKLLDEIFKGIDDEMIHLSAQEFAKSKAASNLAAIIEKTIELSRKDEKYNSLKILLIKYVYRCLEYYTIKGDEIDLDENPAAKCLLNHFPGIKIYMEKIVKGKSISSARIYSDVMSRKDKTEIDEFIIEKYIEYGYFRRAAKDEMDNPKYRIYSMVMVTNYKNHYGESDERYKKAYYIVENEFKKRFRLFRDNNEHEKIDRLTYDYCDLRFIGDNWLKKILEYMNSISIEDFLKSQTYKLVARDIKDSRDNPKAQPFINEFYRQYAIKLAKEKQPLEVNKDEITKYLKPSQKLYAEGYYSLFTEIEINSDSLKKIQKIHSVMELILEKVYNGNGGLTSSDKEIIKRYFDEYYNFTLYTIDQIPSSRKIMRMLIDVKKFGVNLDEDTKFIKSFYSKGLYQELRSNLEPDRLKKGDCDKKQIATMELLTTFSTSESDILEDFLKASGNSYHSLIVNQYVETFIARRLRNKLDYEENYEFIIKYIDEITSEENFSLFNEQYISDILQLIRCNKFSQQYADRINAILEKNLKISTINKNEEKSIINGFIQKYQHTKITSKDELDEFIKHVERLKLVDGRIINSTIINFIIRQTLENDSLISKNVNKYYGFIRSTLEDFGELDLSAKIPRDKYCYLTRDRIIRRSVLGLHDTGRILFTKNAIESFMKDQNIRVLETIFHENVHALQQYDIANGKFENYHRYMMSKELIIERYNRNFYNLNYETMYMEIEAREKAAQKVCSLIQRVLPDFSDRLILDSIKSDLMDEIDKKLEDERENYREAEKKTVSKDDLEKHSVSDIFAKTISEHPEILITHPEFLREFNSDGSQKGLIEILQDMDSKVDNQKEGFLFLNILKNSSIILSEDALDVVQNYQYVNPKMQKYLVILKKHINKNRREELDKESTIPSSGLSSKNSNSEEFER